MRLRSSAQLSPLYRWPDSYVAWAEQLWQRMESVLADRHRSDIAELRAKGDA